MKTTLEDILQDVRKQLSTEFISSEIVGVDGLTIAETAANPNHDSTAIAARMAMVMKLSTKVSEKMQTGTVEDSLITTDTGFMLVRFLGDGSYYWRIAVNKEATIGVVRMLMTEYADRLWDAIPH